MNTRPSTLALLAFAATLLSSTAFSAPADLAAAHKLYQANCAVCHGKDLEGAAGPSLADNTWLHGQPTKVNLARVIGKGVPDKGMPAWDKQLSSIQINQLAEYLMPANTAARQAAAGTAAASGLSSLKLPKGFQIAVYADKVDGARELAVSDSGLVFVGSQKAGKVYALVDANKDGVAEKVVTVAEGLNNPNGVALLNGALYVGEISRILKFDNIEKTYASKPAYTVIKDDLPKESWHGAKYIKAGPDGKLYIPIGAPCNVCDKENEAYSKIWRMNPDGSNWELFARGVRNTVGFTWHPLTKEMWFTDNGRDEMGDNMPACELNVAPKPGMHFGFPYCHGGVLPDPQFGKGKSCDAYVAPVAALGPHVAPLGLAFYTGTQFPEQYRNQLLIAEHGSWNRSSKIGYQVRLVTLYGNKLVSDTAFIDGFLQNEEVSGRPVDVAVMPDGSILVSDDHAHKVYRVTYRP
ncbi:PQQ-dependent sugar dehydrogenase [Pseudoduganella violaceinigra]|uniref:PQQ-dependent sugar dehydrogenase n=1 Tax=Pseudoduganella violaceinigra TaxID=246602 RepID=UPI00041C9691|nr:PQQ-dependent sugar dehydrogenase [Pseudoduganella violaceinigra]